MATLVGFLCAMTSMNDRIEAELEAEMYDITEEQCLGESSEIDSIIANDNNYNSAMQIMNEMNKKMETIELKHEFETVIEKMINKFSNMENDKIEFMLSLALYNEENGIAMELEEWEYENESNSEMDENESESVTSERNDWSDASESTQGWEQEPELHDKIERNESSDSMKDKKMARIAREREMEMEMESHIVRECYTSYGNEKNENENENAIAGMNEIESCQLRQLMLENEKLKVELSNYENEIDNLKKECKLKDELIDDLSKRRNKELTAKWNEKMNDSGLKFDRGFTVNNRYILLSELGSGSYGSVIEAYDSKEKKKRAVKMTNKTGNKEHDEAIIRGMRKEARVMQDLEIAGGCEHFIARIIDSSTYDGMPMIVTQLYGKSLYSSLDPNGGYCASVVRDIGSQICTGVHFIHNLGFVLTDLNTSNVVFENKEANSNKIRLIDFGCVYPKSGVNTRICQIECYRAPEVWFSLPWNESIDMWAFGCLLLELWNGKDVFGTPLTDFEYACMDILNQAENLLCQMPSELANQFAQKIPAMFLSNKKLDINGLNKKKKDKLGQNIVNFAPKPLSLYFNKEDESQALLCDLIEKTMKWHPHERLTANQALNHQFFKMNV